MTEDNTKASASTGVHAEAADDSATRMNEFLFRKTPPCPCRWETDGMEETCNGTIAPDFMGEMPDGMRAVYVCRNCGAVWDHKGDPLPVERKDASPDGGKP